MMMLVHMMTMMEADNHEYPTLTLPRVKTLLLCTPTLFHKG